MRCPACGLALPITLLCRVDDAQVACLTDVTGSGDPRDPVVQLLSDRRSSQHHLSTNLKVLLSLRHYVTWNSFIGEIADFWFRLEDVGPSTVLKLCLQVRGSAAACPTAEQVERAMGGLGTNVNHGHVSHQIRASKLPWSLLRSLDVNSTALCQRFALDRGYTIPEEELVPGARANDRGSFVEVNSFTDTAQWRVSLVPRGSAGRL